MHIEITSLNLYINSQEIEAAVTYRRERNKSVVNGVEVEPILKGHEHVGGNNHDGDRQAELDGNQFQAADLVMSK